MNTTDIFRYIRERLESDSTIQAIVEGKIYPIAIMRNVKLPYIIQNAKLNASSDTKDGEYEREITSTIAVFGENQDVPLQLISEMERLFSQLISEMERLFSGNVVEVDYLDVSEIKVNSWDFDEDDGVFGGIIELTIKIEV